MPDDLDAEARTIRQQYDVPDNFTSMVWSESNAAARLHQPSPSGFDTAVYQALFLLLLERVRIPEYVWGNPIGEGHE